MSDTPFIKFYPSDFLGGTSGLSPAERGVYITLLCLIFDNDGPVVRDDTRLARRCGAPKAAFVRILDALIEAGKVTDLDGMLTNGRAQKALMDRANRSQNAGYAAHARWGAQEVKTEEKQGPIDAGAMRAQCVADASQKPEPDKVKTDVLTKARKRADVSKSRGILETVLSPEVADDFMAHRKAIRKPLTERAAQLIAKQLADHFDPDAVVCASIRNGWTGVFPDSVKAPGGNHEHRTGNGPAARSGNRPDPAIEQIARLAGLVPASRDGGG